MKKNVNVATTILSPHDVATYQSVIVDMQNENTLPKNGVWTYLAKIHTIPDDDYIGAWMYLDGPIVSRSFGPEPAYRYIIFVSADWQDERLYPYETQLYTYLRTLTPSFRRESYRRVGPRFEQSDDCTFDLSAWGVVDVAATGITPINCA